MSADLTQALFAADDRRHQLIIAADIAGLSAMLTDDLVYTHSSAKSDTKAVYLDGISSGRTVFKTFKRSDAVVHSVSPGVAWITGRQTADMIAQGTARVLDLRFLSVWVEQDGIWKMAAWQSTAIPQAA